MDNTEALEVAKQCNHVCNNTFCRDDANNIVALIIQTAINEATADLRAQLAERDAQLAAEKIMVDRLAKVMGRLLSKVNCPPNLPSKQGIIDLCISALEFHNTRQPKEGA